MYKQHHENDRILMGGKATGIWGTTVSKHRYIL